MYNIDRLNLIQNDMNDCLYKYEENKEKFAQVEECITLLIRDKNN